ncbi:MAG TPA: hypothetical protein VEK57_16825 [Thermoanaerobaculia bacterium]|nr:hypothetical protein [Thermoanaerobaculia bacterium]
MKTTLDLPDEILKNAKASAAIRGETLRDYVAAALESRLRHESAPGRAPGGWRSVFGAVRRTDVAAIDQIVSRDLEEIEPDDWR